MKRAPAVGAYGKQSAPAIEPRRGCPYNTAPLV